LIVCNFSRQTLGKSANEVVDLSRRTWNFRCRLPCRYTDATSQSDIATINGETEGTVNGAFDTMVEFGSLKIECIIMSLNIKNETAHRYARELASLTGR